MVDVIGRAKVIVEGDVDPSSINAAGGKIGDTLKRGAVVGVAALGTLAVGAIKSVKAFQDAEAQSRKLNQVLSNMKESQAGPAVEKLAESLSRVTGVEDEVIKQGETVLATFSQVAESAGNTGGVFERATRAAVDLSATGFGSVESASVMLGKALQDPEKGIQALSRAGVTFTESQKQTIASMLETNNIAGAQKLILEEVEKQVGGTAEANATESARIATAWGEVQEAVGGALSELTGGEVTSFSDALFEMADAIEALGESEGWENVGEFLRGLKDDLKDNDTFLGRNVESQKSMGESLLDLADTVEDAWGVIKEAHQGAKKDWGDWADAVTGAINDALDAITGFEDTGNSKLLNKKYSGGDIADLLDPTRRAVGGPAAGWTVVNERGPELIDLPNGSYVHNTNETERMLAGDTINNFTIMTTSGGAGLVQELDWWARFASPDTQVVQT